VASRALSCEIRRNPAEPVNRRQYLKGGDVAAPSQPGYLSPRYGGYHGLLPELLPGKDIGEVHFDHRPGGIDEGVTQRDPIVGKGARVDDDAGGLGGILLDELHQAPFMVGLEDLHIDPEIERRFLDQRVDLCKRLVPVEGDLPGTQLVQVRTMNDKYLHCSSSCSLLGCAAR